MDLGGIFLYCATAILFATPFAATMLKSPELFLRSAYFESLNMVNIFVFILQGCEIHKHAKLCFQKAAKEKIVSGDYLNKAKVPQDLVDILCNELQSFIIDSLKKRNNQYFTKSKGLEDFLKKIMKTKFPSGVAHKHLLAHENSTDYFPWAGLFGNKGRLL